jgi:Uma2 family endonuclease
MEHATFEPMLDPAQIAPGQIRPLRRAEYDKLVELGVFHEDERIELLCGFLVAMSPQGAPHAGIAAELTEILIERLGRRAQVRCGMPFAATEWSEPEPDIAVVPRRSYFDAHPERAHLIVEVSYSSLRLDRNVKRGIYAAAGVPEYWIVDVVDEVVELHSAPVDGEYTVIQRVERGGVLRPLEFPDVALAVDDLLPPARAQ